MVHMYGHFSHNAYPCIPFFPYFFTTFPLLGLFPPQHGALAACPQYGTDHVSTSSHLLVGSAAAREATHRS